MRIFTIFPSLRQNQDPGRVCRADAGVGLLSAHWAPGNGKLGCSQAAPAGPGSPNCRWEADPAGLPPGLPAGRRAHRETHAVRCHLSLPRPSTHDRCQSGLQITICKKTPATVERPYVSHLVTIQPVSWSFCLVFNRGERTYYIGILPIFVAVCFPGVSMG